MSMKVEKQQQVIFKLSFAFNNKIFQGDNFRENESIWIQKLSVKVSSTQTRSVVTRNNSIWVQHWYNFKYYPFS